MHHEKDPISTALKESLKEKLGAAYEVRRILHLSPLATEVLLNSVDRGLFRARIYNVKEPDFESFRDAWMTHQHLLAEIDHPRLKPTFELEQLGQSLALSGGPTTGLSLETYCRYVGPMAPTFATRLLLKIIGLFQELYQSGGHHLNLELENIYVDKNGDIYFTNYGLWNFEIELADLWGLKELINPSFLSPEHLSGKTLTVSSEIYQLGVLYFKLVTGILPFDGEYEEIRESHLKKAPPNPQATRDDISIGLARILARALAKKPNERFWTLADFQKTLSLLLPHEERHIYSEDGSIALADGDLQDFEEQLDQAKDQYKNDDFEGALHTVGAVLMVAGTYKPAIELAGEIRAKNHQERIRKLWDDARYVLDMGQPDGALDPLHQILNLDPNHEQTRQLQSQLFEVLEDQSSELGKPLPVQAYMEQAGVAKTLEDFALAESLWYMVLLTPSPQESSFLEIMQMQKKVARHELETLYALNKSTGSTPSDKIPKPDLDASTFGDEELEQLFAPISPEITDEMESPPDGDDDLFDDLTNALDESQVDLSLPPESLTEEELVLKAELATPPLSHLDMGAPATMNLFDDQVEQVAPTQAAVNLFDDQVEQVAPTQAMPYLAEEPTPKVVPTASSSAPVALAEKARSIDQTDLTPVKIQKDTQGKPPRSLVPILGGIAALILIVVSFVVIKRINASKAFRVAATLAYSQASNMEDDGEWAAALTAWREAETDYPNFMDIPERTKTLEYKIKDREADIQRYADQARSYLDAGTYYGNGTENAVAYLRQILALNKDHPAASAMFQELADLELAKARQLFSEEKVSEAQEVYSKLLQANSRFADPTFEATLNAWMEDKVIGPQLTKIERAIKRKRWDQALEMSGALRESMKNPAALDALWHQAYSDIEKKLLAAEAKGQKARMLSQIELLSQIRPDDQSLVNRRNQLNREINQSKITNLETTVEKALKAKNYDQAGRSARKLERLDSESGLAKSALDEIRNHYLRRIRGSKNGNPRAAHKSYKDLIKIFNWKSYRNEMNTLNSRIAEFDKQLKALRNGGTKSYDKQIGDAVRLNEQFSDFSLDPAYPTIVQIKDRLIAEKSRLATLQGWEESARNNVAKSYTSILQHLQKAGPFNTAFGKKNKADLMARYRDLIENYQGAVILVIRSAKGLPKESAGLNRAPEAFCEFTAGGKTLTTSVVNNSHNPTWDYTGNIIAKPGQPLNFAVYDSERGNKKELLGSITLKKIPKSTKAMVLKHKNGWSILIDVRRER